MSKVEERGKTYALHKASEKLNDYYGNAMLSVVQFDGHDIQRAFTEGYHQAEKDLELTEKDISTIRKIMFDYNRQIRKGRQLRSIIPIPNESEYCKEVLKRFKERKEK